MFSQWCSKKQKAGPSNPLIRSRAHQSTPLGMTGIREWQFVPTFNSEAHLSLMVVFFFALGHRDHAPMRYFAHRMLELDSRVVNAEVVIQTRSHVPKNALTRRWRDVGDGDMARQRAGLRSDAPHVEVVDIIDAVNFADACFHPRKFHSAR